MMKRERARNNAEPSVETCSGTDALGEVDGSVWLGVVFFGN